MQKLFVNTTVAASMLFAPAVASGQAPIERDAPITRTSNLTLEQRHVIKEIIKDSKVENAPADIQVAVGNTVPKSIHLELMLAQKFRRSRPICSSSKAAESSSSIQRTTRSLT